MESLKQKLRQARSAFDSAIAHGRAAFEEGHPFRDFARLEGQKSYKENIEAVFGADYQPVVQSADTVKERLIRCARVFSDHKAAYEDVFADSANREICVAASNESLRGAFRKILKS